METTAVTNGVAEQVETLLKSQDTPNQSKDAPCSDTASAYVASTVHYTLPTMSEVNSVVDNGPLSIQDASMSGAIPLQQPSADDDTTGEAGLSWEMIGLGLEEPLPPSDVMDDLWDIFS